eukprot:g5664.t1
MLGALGLFSVIYLFSSHILVTQQGPAMHGMPPTAGQGGGGDGDGGGDDVLYDGDPRHVGRGTIGQQLLQPNEPAEDPMDYIPLQCEGGVPDVDLSYWKNIPQDKMYQSPWGAQARQAKSEGMPQYVTFEPDRGGFNNIRMAMETVLVFARETGRTLVMPAAQKFYLLNRPAVEFADMFPIEYLSEYMDVISMEEFLEREGLTGHLGQRPPGNKVSGHTMEELQDYLRSVSDVKPHWHHMSEALVFGPSPDDPAVPGDEESQSIPARGDDEYRLFTHFYTFIGLSDPVAARHHRRLVRDLVHFRESLFCTAATIVGRLRTAGGGDPGRWSGYYGEWGGLGERDGGMEGGAGDGEVAGVGGGGYEGGDGGVQRKAGFSTFHIRRGDFQYTRMKPAADVIKAATVDLVRPGEVLFIATDERKKEFFDVIAEDHQVFYLSDFMDVLVGIDPSYYLMIDTIVASQGRTFIGTWRSTFTGYITRLRGYYRYPTEFSWYFWDEAKQEYVPKCLAASLRTLQSSKARRWRAPCG